MGLEVTWTYLRVLFFSLFCLPERRGAASASQDWVINQCKIQSQIDIFVSKYFNPAAWFVLLFLCRLSIIKAEHIKKKNKKILMMGIIPVTKHLPYNNICNNKHCVCTYIQYALICVYIYIIHEEVFCCLELMSWSVHWNEMWLTVPLCFGSPQLHGFKVLAYIFFGALLIYMEGIRFV